jgi:hypothetical protein
MIATALAILLAAGPSLSPAGQAVVDQVKAAIDKTRAKQAQLPPAEGLTEQLIRLGQLDQAPRQVIVAFDFSTIPEAERQAAATVAGDLINELDAENQTKLLKLLPPEGWVLSSRYGKPAADAAFHIIQHSDLSLQRRFLPILEPLVKKGEVTPNAYGAMFDRVATSEGRPQRYGTQFRCDGGKWRPYPIEDPEGLDARRNQLGFQGPTFAEIKARFASDPYCPQTQSPPPPGMVLN